MDISDPVANEPTDEDVTRIAHRPCEPEDFLPLGVAPPASLYSLSSYGLGQVWNRPARALEDNAMALDKCEGSSRSH